MTLPGHDQSRSRVRMEWGPTGATAVPADYAVVVDVLSFTTTLSVALERGIEVFPFRWRDARAAEHAMRHGATLAVGRFEALSRGNARHVSLSPASLAEVEGIERLVLPSPNGSTIAFALADTGAQVVGACLRNAGAVARWLAPRVADGASVVVVPAGERWYDDTLRPAVEDLWGAGAVLDALGHDDEVASPEARMAAAAWRAVQLPDDLLTCASGVELAEAGFVADVEIAGQRDVSEVVPVLVGESFRDATELRPTGPTLRRVRD
ncbi:2-phosphosulfolactate phosphatase [Nocardioides KLBMP 9356]|uniref:Probable 2-phosphosulfolactate phosphatase n=1 Tax=Nocardioides potassii TaxID=2911371 RepID=A0ABS9HB40_9ACTN|nr:2-phosphosulfolactate phosphatase [Nocardioides potassii]MCF6378385.1 2-phosphosulfolactate phosphatase [Nocardioides potassii]